MLWVLIWSTLLLWHFWVPTTYIFMEKEEKYQEFFVEKIALPEAMHFQQKMLVSVHNYGYSSLWAQILSFNGSTHFFKYFKYK